MVQHFILQRSIEAAINRSSFTASLPPLSDKTWMKILAYTSNARAENERLEFVGDALMYATIGRLLYAQLPDGTPHLYTCVRAVLHSNATFSLLAEKLDIMAVSSTVLHALTRRTFGEGKFAPRKSRPEVKATADLFETVIGAYYLDYGFEALYSWVEEIYTPLLKAVAETFFAHQHQHDPHWHRVLGMKKRTIGPFIFKSGLLTAPSRAQPQAAASPLRKKVDVTPLKQRVRTLDKIKATRRSRSRKGRNVGIASSNAKLKGVPANNVNKPSASSAITQVAPVVKNKAPPTIIDLTLDSESDNCEPLFRHPLVTPRILRSSAAVSKRPTPVPPPAKAPLPALVPAGSGSSSSDSDDDMMLESMLIDSEEDGSDMDCGSSDVKTPARPSNLVPFLTRIACADDALEMPQLPHMYRNILLR